MACFDGTTYGDVAGETGFSGFLVQLTHLKVREERFPLLISEYSGVLESITVPGFRDTHIFHYFVIFV